MNGIINLIKPPRLSSAQAVSFVKRLTREKAGHAGTLDPEACGVLPIMVGKATRLFDYLTEREKVYVAVIHFGSATDTQDATGTVTERGEKLPSKDSLLRILPQFAGDILQVPPAFSALKRDGDTLYKLARQGKAPTLEARSVRVDSITMLRQISPSSFSIRVVCGKGTYIRTLCHDIGQALNCPAHMGILIREQSGPYRIEDGLTVEELERRLAAGESDDSVVQSMAQALDHMPRVDAPDEAWRSLISGVPLSAGSVPMPEAAYQGQAICLYCRQQLIGIYRLQAESLKVSVMLYSTEEA